MCFFLTSLNKWCKARLPDEDISIPTPNPKPSQSLPLLCTELMPEPTTVAETEPAAMNEPVKRAQPTIAPEPEPNERSDQVHELATQ